MKATHAPGNFAFFVARAGNDCAMKKPTPDERKRICTGKRRYRTQGDALDAAMIAGVERQRQAYHCKLCGRWHLTTV